MNKGALLMQNLFNYFMIPYNGYNFILKLKARIVFFLTLLLIIFFAVMAFLTLVVVGNKGALLRISIPLVIILTGIPLALYFLKKGKLAISSNIILTVCFVCIWSAIFLGNKEQVYSQLDTIVLVMVIQVIIPIISNLRGIIIFNTINILLFSLFIKFVLVDSMNLSTRIVSGYATDNGIAIIVISLLTYFIYYINNIALQRSEEEAEKSKKRFDIISSILKSVQNTSEMLATSSQELSGASRILSSNAQSQAASSEEITATVEEISAGVVNITGITISQTSSMDSLLFRMDEFSFQIDQTRDNLNNLLQQTEEITRYAQTGDNNLKLMNESMVKISSSSGEMSTIINMINDISDQINLLSLNAAIEAARAGDAGRGFAVVADEISKLADRTSQSVKEISSLIAGNNNEIKNGIQNVEATFDTLKNIISGVQRMYDMMHDITSQIENQVEVNNAIQKETGIVKEQSDTIKISTEEQKTASTEIVKSISIINNASQANASGSEEVAVNAKEIAALADKLKDEVRIYSTE